MSGSDREVLFLERNIYSVSRKVKIIKAKLEDSEAIVALLLGQFEEHAIETGAERLGQAVREMLRNDNLGFLLLAKAGARTIGVAAAALTWTLEHGGKAAWLDELYVEPEYRGKGVGTALLRAALEAAQRSGCAAVDLEVDEEHARAENLYKREGFQRLTRARWVKQIM